MHALLAAFFAAIFSFSHAQTVRHNDAFVASDAVPVAYESSAPTREQLAHEAYATVSSYAESSCVSCRRMNVDSTAR